MADETKTTTIVPAETSTPSAEPEIDFRDVIPDDNFEQGLTETPSTDTQASVPDSVQTTPDVTKKTPTPGGDATIPPPASSAAPRRGDALPAEPPAQPSGAPSADTEWPEELLAAEGFTRQKAMSVFGTPERFEQAVMLRDRQVVENARLAMLQQQRAQQLQQQAAQLAYQQQLGRQGPPQQSPVTQPSGGVKFEMPKPKIGGDEKWDEDVTELASALAKHAETVADMKVQAVMQQLGTLQQLMGHLAQDRLRSAQQSYVESFESRISGLGDEFKDLFGTGSGRALKQDSPELANRIRLDTVIGAIQNARQRQGLAPLSEDDAFRRALIVEFPDRFEQTLRAKVAGQVANRQRQMTARPTSRKTTGMTPEERASAFADNWAQQNRASGALPMDIPVSGEF